MSYARRHFGRGIFAAAGLGQTTGKTTSGKTGGSSEPDRTASDWTSALTTAGTLASSIIGAATGAPSASAATTSATPEIDAATATAPPVSASPMWYWPVVIGVGVAVLGGIAYMGWNVKKPVKSNRGRRRRRMRRNTRQRRSAAIVDERSYSVVDRMTGLERRHLTRDQVPSVIRAHRDQCDRYGWRTDIKVFYRDGTDVTSEFAVTPNRLSPRKRASLPRSTFVFPERRAYPLDTEKRAYDAISMMRLGRVRSASDFAKIRNAIRSRYPEVWSKYGKSVTWDAVRRAKTKARTSRARTMASKMAANRRR